MRDTAASAVEPDRTASLERELLSRLAIGAGASTVVGLTAWLQGHHAGRRQMRDFGRQAAAWGAVDGAVAAIGWALSARREGARSPTRAREPAEQIQRARRLRSVTAVNAVADVGYVAGGLRRVGAGRSGDGWAIVLQGLFLCWLDALYTVRFHDLVSASTSERHGPLGS